MTPQLQQVIISQNDIDFLIIAWHKGPKQIAIQQLTK